MTEIEQLRQRLSEVEAELIQSRAETEGSDALCVKRGEETEAVWQKLVHARRENESLRADQERMREALKGCANLRLFVEVYDGRAFDKARILAFLDAVDVALSTPRQP